MPIIKILISGKDQEILDSIAQETMQATGDVMRNMLRLGLNQYREYLDSEKHRPGYFTSLVLGIKATPSRIDRGDTYIPDDLRLSLEREAGIRRDDLMDGYKIYTPQGEKEG